MSNPLFINDEVYLIHYSQIMKFYPSDKKHRDSLNFTLREEYHTVLRQYEDLVNHKKNEFVNSRLLELENTVDDSDNKKFWNCLKSMDDTIKETSIPPVTEENWMSHFQSLHSNEPLMQRSNRNFNILHPRANPGHLAISCARGVGNLTFT